MSFFDVFSFHYMRTYVMVLWCYTYAVICGHGIVLVLVLVLVAEVLVLVLVLVAEVLLLVLVLVSEVLVLVLVLEATATVLETYLTFNAHNLRGHVTPATPPFRKKFFRRHNGTFPASMRAKLKVRTCRHFGATSI